ncbi:D-tyrosyl-tRNA(Tyr) deacylase [uncultured delta proteobacterium]|uniref:D-aminoacyl-tRNA deacylase n=1 Tax=uncultured delta proteobacterium TaxID=34034 RepID=A0A212IT95_9DELT|nr:D-tyrosyl-tRNA(Tyr) deacylase [uncultured delta proteobacterium]
MRLVVQRVRQACVSIGGETVAAIDTGLLVLAGLGPQDAEAESWPKIEAVLAKLPVLRIFPDNENHMNVGLADCGGEILLVSQFTLFADCRKGRRPSFHLACPPDRARPLFEKVVAATEALLPGKVKSGIFAADMDVALVNWGPVTIILDSEDF